MKKIKINQKLFLPIGIIISIMGILISCTNESNSTNESSSTIESSSTTESEILSFEAEKLNFEITDKNIFLHAIDFFNGYKLNSSTGAWEAMVITSAPEKGKVYVTFKIDIINHNIDTVKIIILNDLKVQTNDGEDIPMHTEFDDGFASAPYTLVLPPEEKKVQEFLLYITEKEAKNVKILFLNKEEALINFMKFTSKP